MGTRPVDATPDRYGSMLDQLREGFQVLGPYWHYLYVNDAVVTHARRTRDELLGSTMLELYPGIEATPMFAVLERCMHQRTSAELENHFTYPDGAEAWFELRIHPVPEGLAVLSIDITARKDLEARLHQSQRLDAAGRIAAGMAHDFGNLLTAIQGACKLALTRDVEPGVRGDIELAVSASDRAQALVEELMSFCRQRAVAPQLLDIEHHIGGFAALLTHSLADRHLLRLTLGATPLVHIDIGAFEQVVLNLVVNASEAMSGPGTITIGSAEQTFDRATRVGAVMLDPGRYAVLTVTDTGAGMSPDVLGRVFEPFFTTKHGARGTGLGLSTGYGIVRQAGGVLAVRSAPDEGATFTIYLPAARALPTEATPPAEASRAIKPADG